MRKVSREPNCNVNVRSRGVWRSRPAPAGTRFRSSIPSRSRGSRPMDCKLAAMLVCGCLSVGGPSAVRADPGPGKAVVMKAGVAKTVITPKDWKELTTVMGTKATHKDHELYARALALSD